MICLEALKELLDAASDALVASPALEGAAGLSDEELFHLLIQRRFVSLAFTPFYDAIIDAADDAVTRVVCRQLLREEYPDQAGNTPSHRELLVTDLAKLGVDKHRLRAESPTAATGRAIIASFELVPAASRETHSELAVAATAACYAESLVAAEYKALRPRLEKKLRLENTVFYGPHLLHDDGHAKRLLEQVRMAIGEDYSRLDTFNRVVERCLRVKVDFYSQFEVDGR